MRCPRCVGIEMKWKGTGGITSMNQDYENLWYKYKCPKCRLIAVVRFREAKK